jgi:hypothetical protein
MFPKWGNRKEREREREREKTKGIAVDLLSFIICTLHQLLVRE